MPEVRNLHFQHTHLGFLSTHGLSSTFSLNFQVCNSVGKRELGFRVYYKRRSEKEGFIIGNQRERYLLEKRDCRDSDKVIKNQFELLKVKLRKASVKLAEDKQKQFP